MLNVVVVVVVVAAVVVVSAVVVVVVVVTRCVWLQAAVCSVYYGWLQLDWAGSCCPASHYSIHWPGPPAALL